MEYKIFDTHVHSNNSFDARGSVEDLTRAALESGLSGMVITDHCDMNLPEEHDRGRKIIDAYHDVLKARECVKGREFFLGAGIELGQPGYDEELTEGLMEEIPFDYIILSRHCSGSGMDIPQIDFRKVDVDTFLGEYFHSILEMVEKHDFDSLGHLTFPVRYLEDAGLEYDLAAHSEIIDEILRVLIRRNKSLEINTSGLRKKMGATMPGIDIIRRYWQLSGRLVTIGSDAHSTDDIGKGFDRAVEVLRDIGFAYYVYYRKREMYKVYL